MSTLNQIKINKRLRKNKKSRASLLKFRPQIRGVVLRVRIQTPKKPNSARRPVAKILLSTKRNIVAHIPGIGHNLRKHSEVLIRGGGTRDLPGINYTCVRGKFDLLGVLNKRRRRSIYGIKLDSSLKTKLRRKFRNI